MKTITRIIGIAIALILSACAGEPGIATPPSPTPNQRQTPLPTITAIPTPTLPPDVGPQQVVIVRLTGLSMDDVLTMTASGDLPTLARLMESGAWGQLDVGFPNTPTATAYSLACGCSTVDHGIAGERLHDREDSFYWYTAAADLPSDVGPFWAEQEVQAALVGWPGHFKAAWSVPAGRFLAYSDLHDLTLYPSTGWQGVELADGDQAYEGQFTIRGDSGSLASVYVLVLNTFDSTPHTTIFSLGDRQFDEPDLMLDLTTNDTGHWTFDEAARRGVDLTVTNAQAGRLEVFQSRVYELDAEPATLNSEIVADAGHYPPAADWYALDRGWISREQFLAMAERQSMWQADVSTSLLETYDPDLLLISLDAASQIRTELGLVPVGEAAVATALEEPLSRIVEAVSDGIEAGDTTLVVVASDGLIHAERQVYLNRVLAESGWLTLDSRGYVVSGSSQAVAMAWGGTAHIYLNRAGYQRDGILDDAQYQAIQAEIIEALSSLTDPGTDEVVLSGVWAADDADNPVRGAAYGGDIVVQAAPGYVLSDDRAVPVTFGLPTVGGAQGVPLDGFWLAAGAGLAAGEMDQPYSLNDVSALLHVRLASNRSN